MKLVPQTLEMYESLKSHSPEAARRYLIYLLRWKPHTPMCFNCGSYDLNEVVREVRKRRPMTFERPKPYQPKMLKVRGRKPGGDVEFLCAHCGHHMKIKNNIGRLDIRDSE